MKLVQTSVPLSDLSFNLEMAKARLGLFTARHRADGGLDLVTLLFYDDRAALWTTPLPEGAVEYPSITPTVPQAHWFERGLHDMFGVRPVGHPRFKSLWLHEAWPRDFHPLRRPWALPDETAPRRTYHFLEVQGEGVYEIPVGPIHAGIIEPGHFRFSCLGEIIENLEIRLGYQHRGVERRLAEVPWRKARFVAEAASSDTTVANAWAHALALEQLLGVEVPPAVDALRAVALEVERIANHVGDLGGIASDIGYAGGSTIFGQLRGQALGLAETLSGSRIMTAYVAPGGFAQAPDREALLRQAEALEKAFRKAAPLLLDNAEALERMEGIGRVRRSLARDFGLVGPAGRACGLAYDARTWQPPYGTLKWEPARGADGDVLDRVRVRVAEVLTSLDMLRQLVPALTGPWRTDLPAVLAPNAVGLGIVEAWRGELIHLVFTDSEGRIDRYCIKDPSLNNWTGLAIAARGQLVGDFPLCNKSFSLSYSGNDL